MPSLDIVSTVDMQALDNAINNVKREIATRYDFRNIVSEISLNHKDKLIHISSGEEMKVKAITDSLIGQCTRLKLDPKILDPQKIEPAAHGTAKRDVNIKEGISRETAQKIVKFIKASGLKVQAAIQDDQIRVTGKQIDDLQELMGLLRAQDYDVPLQFVNMKR
ncbi:MAG: YajQ family cyclic di-GMP-binding protein [Dehalococcoidia bacterium]|nr:MAG: YajQ family cyclic di-GMP-binding protein [Dehalococcoidia bacterium]